jgi:hypothetical protein
VIPSSHVCVCLLSGLFPLGFPSKALCTFLSYTMCATCPAHLIYLDLICLVLFWMSTHWSKVSHYFFYLCNILQSISYSVMQWHNSSVPLEKSVIRQMQNTCWWLGSFFFFFLEICGVYYVHISNDTGCCTTWSSHFSRTVGVVFCSHRTPLSSLIHTVTAKQVHEPDWRYLMVCVANHAPAQPGGSTRQVANITTLCTILD